MTDQLTDLLQRRADDLPVYVQSVAGLKQAAERTARRRRLIGVTATAGAVAVIVGAGALLTRPDGRALPPTPAVTDSPQQVPADRGLLLPSQLPNDETFTGWTGAKPAKASDIPLCLKALGAPVDAAYQQFTTDQPDTAAYQAVFNLGSVKAAAKGADDTNLPQADPDVPLLITKLLACAPLDGDGWDSAGGRQSTSVMPHVGPSHRVQLMSRAHAGPYLSVLWLSTPGTRTLSFDQVNPFNDALETVLYEGTANPLQDVPTGSLAQAMLQADDVPLASSSSRGIRDDLMTPNAFIELHMCDSNITTGKPAMRNVLFIDDTDGTPAAQRLYVADSPDDAHRLLSELRQAVRRCPTADTWSGRVDSWTNQDMPELGDEAATLSFRLGFVAGTRRGKHDIVYVYLARVGSVVTEVVRREPTETDPGPQAAADFARQGVQRLLDSLPANITGQTT